MRDRRIDRDRKDWEKPIKLRSLISDAGDNSLSNAATLTCEAIAPVKN